VPLTPLSCGALARATLADRSKEIVVGAPRSVSPAPTQRSERSSAALIMTVRVSALHGDLDLSGPDRVTRLEPRIERAAQNACRQLDRLLPRGPGPDCFVPAIANARPGVEAAIASAAR